MEEEESAGPAKSGDERRLADPLCTDPPERSLASTTSDTQVCKSSGSEARALLSCSPGARSSLSLKFIDDVKAPNVYFMWGVFYFMLWFGRPCFKKKRKEN